MTVRVTDRDWLLGVLSDGKPHSHAEILRRSMDDRGHGLTVHSRASDLRHPEHGGHDIQVSTWRANGRVHSSYQLVARAESQSLPSPDGPASCDSTDATASLAEPPPLLLSGEASDNGNDNGGSAGETVLCSQPTLSTESGAGPAHGVGCEEGDGQSSLFQIPERARGAYDEVAA